MAFSSIYVPEFSIQAVVRAEPVLRHRAIALIEGHPPLERVVARNEAAARMGIDLGMTKSQAAQFPSIKIRQRSRIEERSTHAALLDLGWSVSPRVEDTAVDSIVVDLAGLACLFGSEETIANLLAKRASDLGLIVQVAISGNLEVALHAARGFPGITVIPPGEESKRLGPLPIQVFSPPAEILETFERWGVRTCEALAKLPLLQLSERLGQPGVQLHQWARGAGARSMILAEPTLSFEEEMALDYALEELEPLAFLLGRLLDQLCARLTARSLGACALRLRFGLDTSSDNESSPPPNRNACADEKKSYEKVLTLPVAMRDSKMLLKLLRLHLQSDPPSAPIVHIFLAADPAPPRVTQEGLFLPSAPDPEKLELTIARLANVVGNSHVGAPRLIDSHRPDAFEMCRFLPPHDAPRIHQKSIRQQMIGLEKREPLSAFRVFRPAPRVKVTLREGRPAHISFPSMHGEVAAASGPWRTSGEWWREDAWCREEWDVEVRRPSISSANVIENSSSVEPQKGVYRIYYDVARQAWFVAGMYD